MNIKLIQLISILPSVKGRTNAKHVIAKTLAYVNEDVLTVISEDTDVVNELLKCSLDSFMSSRSSSSIVNSEFSPSTLSVSTSFHADAFH